MKHTLFPSGLAICVALAVTPIVAQAASLATTPSVKAAMQSAPQTKRQVSHRQNRRHAAHMRYDAQRNRRSMDNIANSLNRDELRKLSGSTMPPATTAATPTATSNLAAPGTLGGVYGQPSPTQGIPGGNQPSASPVRN